MVGKRSVLITGASGLLGKYLIETAPSGIDAVGTWFTSFMPNGYRIDITDKVIVNRVFDRVRPHAVIHCAAIGSVDYCETHWQSAWDVNVEGFSNILEAAEAYRAKVVFVSSNAVYAGDAAPYTEESARIPVNRYGAMKREAEDLLLNYHRDYLIVRPIMLYGWPPVGGRSNWVTRVLESLRNENMTYIVDDTLTQPTYAEDCAKAIWCLLHTGKCGVYNIAGMDRMSLYDMAICVACAWGLDGKSIHPVKSSFFKDLAPRPKDTTYDLTKLWDLDIPEIRPSGLVDGLERMKSVET